MLPLVLAYFAVEGQVADLVAAGAPFLGGAVLDLQLGTGIGGIAGDVEVVVLAGLEVVVAREEPVVGAADSRGNIGRAAVELPGARVAGSHRVIVTVEYGPVVLVPSVAVGIEVQRLGRAYPAGLDRGGRSDALHAVGAFQHYLVGINAGCGYGVIDIRCCLAGGETLGDGLDLGILGISLRGQLARDDSLADDRRHAGQIRLGGIGPRQSHLEGGRCVGSSCQARGSLGIYGLVLNLEIGDLRSLVARQQVIGVAARCLGRSMDGYSLLAGLRDIDIYIVGRRVRQTCEHDAFADDGKCIFDCLGRGLVGDSTYLQLIILDTLRVNSHEIVAGLVKVEQGRYQIVVVRRCTGGERQCRECRGAGHGDDPAGGFVGIGVGSLPHRLCYVAVCSEAGDIGQRLCLVAYPARVDAHGSTVGGSLGDIGDELVSEGSVGTGDIKVCGRSARSEAVGQSLDQGIVAVYLDLGERIGERRAGIVGGGIGPGKCDLVAVGNGSGQVGNGRGREMPLLDLEVVEVKSRTAR